MYFVPHLYDVPDNLGDTSLEEVEELCDVVNSASVCNYRSSRPEVFRKKGALRNLLKFTGKHLCQRFKNLHAEYLMEEDGL